MQYVNGLIGCFVVLIGLVHVPHPMPLTWLPYLGAAALAFATLKSEISPGVAKVLGIATTAAMFFFFAGFFVVAPKLAADWYMRPEGWDAVGRIMTGFLMLPILSEYTCRFKPECRDALEKRRRSFFSAPNSAPSSAANHTPPR